MNVKVISLTEKEMEERGYCGMLAIEIDGGKVFNVYDGEAEDNSLGRNFSDCNKVPGLLKRAYDAGKNGEDFNMTSEEVEEY